LLALAQLGFSSGCASSPAGGAIDRWASRQGGVVDDPSRAEAANRALQALRFKPGGDCQVPSVAVLDCPIPAAYAWPCGRIFVSTGLVDLLDRDELIAAIAHELGHLCHDPAPQARVALRGGTCVGDDGEIAADAAGRDLLRRSGCPVAALTSMLRKVAAHPLTPADCRSHLERRAALLASNR